MTPATKTAFVCVSDALMRDIESHLEVLFTLALGNTNEPRRNDHVV